MATRNKRVVKYRKRKHIHVGIIVFAIIFIYLVAYMLFYFSRDKVTIYETVMGKNATLTNKTFNGLILRDETIVSSDTSGYLNYFVKEGERVSIGSTVYTVDESGTINQLLSNASSNGVVTISKDDESILRKSVSQMTGNYSNNEFEKVYDFKFDLESTVLECINLSNIQNLLNSANNSGMKFKINTAAKTGIVAYYTDGFEGKTANDISSDSFKTSNYKKNSRKSGDLIENGAAVYKVVNSEEWNIYIELSEDDVKKYEKDTSIKIKVTSDQNIMRGDFSIVNIAGKQMGKITLNQFMSSYINDRFIEIQIVEKQIEGLKIPVTSVVEKDFYIIPIGYGGNGGNTSDIGFFMEKYDDKGNKSIQFVSPTIYFSSEEYYYVDKEAFEVGDNIVMVDGTNAFRVSATASLKGVYNVNKGYCLFRRIDIISEIDHYYLIKPDTTYGLRVYDHIVIDGSIVKENQVVFN